MSDYSGIIKRYESAKSVRYKYVPLWGTISRYTGIKLDETYFDSPNDTYTKQLDQFVDDPTSAITVNQFGDYLVGVMWGTGDKAFKLKPSRHLLELVEQEEVQDYLDFATENMLYHMNHERAGLSGAMQCHAYSQGSFGTSGVGAFPNQAFEKGIDENAIVFRDYGVDNIAIGEGPSGLVDYVYVRYNWTATRIVNEFCFDKGTISDEKVSALPKKIQDAWNNNDEQNEFQLICAVFPRDDFNPKLKGKLGTRFKGIWFLEDEKENVFHEDDYRDMPIPIARASKVRGEVYGRSNSTMLLSSIRALNFMVKNTIEILEKMSDPSMGMWSDAVAGDNVVDTSARGLTVFNPALTAGNQPMWQLYDVGDPSGVINFLIPYLKENITTASKVDALLDFNSAKEMTATESLQRYAIRGKSLSGLLIQQKNELLLPLVKRCSGILWESGELGIRPDDDRAESIKARAPQRIIPEAILELEAQGKQWFNIEFNNELENLTRTQEIERLLQFAQALQLSASIDPSMLQSSDIYEWLQSIYDNLSIKEPLMIGQTKFKQVKEAQAQMQAQMMAMQAGQAGAQIQKDSSQANKNNAEANNGR
jgi:hypothetical protein